MGEDKTFVIYCKNGGRAQLGASILHKNGLKAIVLNEGKYRITL